MSLHILIVEDDPDQKILLQRLLEALGYDRISHASCGAQAIEFYQDQLADLILMDIGLGQGPDGITIAQQIFERNPTPIVFVTSHVDEESILRARQTGTFGYVIKPVSRDSLRAAIELAMLQFNQAQALNVLLGQLKESEERYRAMFDRTLAITLLIDPISGRLLDANPAALEYYGYPREELLKLYIFDLNTLKQVEVNQEMHKARNENRNYFLFKHRLASGEIRDVEVYSNPIYINGKQQLYSLIHDVTERRLAEESLKLSSIVFENTIEGIWITDANFGIIEVNRAFSDITEYSKEEVLGQNPGMFTAGRNPQNFLKDMWSRLNQKGYWQGEIWNRRKAGESYPEWLTITRVANENGETKNFVGVFSDITRRKMAEERLNYMATHDALTDLPNRTFLNEHLRKSLLKAQRLKWLVAVFFLDLDRFKTLNDTMGHQIGDILLEKVARRLHDCTRDSDTVARIGGDEFIMVFEDIGRSQNAIRLAQKIIKIIEKPYFISEREIFISTSIGISISPHDGNDAMQLIRNADIAMYRVKQRGRSGFEFFQEQMHTEAQERATIEQDLRHAIGDDQFYLVFQPVVDLSSQRILGAEALLRWEHPVRGLIGPDRFISIAEESGLITAITEWVLKKAVLVIQNLEAQGLDDFYIAINLSARHLHQHDITNQIQSRIEDAGIQPRHLIVEVTESAMMQEPETARQVLAEINALGIRIALDDFGTGYSSLNYLQKIPFDLLKIDRSFLTEVSHNHESQALVRSIAGIARGMNKRIIVEGVENTQQIQFLAGEGLHCLQGFYIKRPQPLEIFQALLHHYKNTPIPVDGKLINPTAANVEQITHSAGQGQD